MTLTEEKNISGSAFLTFPFMEQYGLFCCFTSRAKGYSKKPYDFLNLAYHVGDERDAVKRNRQLVLEKLLKKSSGYLFSVRQVHGDRIINVTEGIDHADGDIGEEADGLMTDHKNIPIMVMGADCSLIIIADIKHKAVCTVHSGWKGTLNGIAEKALKGLSGKFGSGPDNIKVFLGPCIRQCCYEIDNSLADRFIKRFGKSSYILSKNEKAYLDLAGLNRKLVIDSGILAENIIDTGVCTGCNDKYFSYRKEKVTGRQAAIAMVA
jgi:YfiH family protein